MGRRLWLNDPILLKMADDLYWLSIADSNIWFWASAIAAERGLDVEISEPDVAPMAVQGPKAEDVVAAVFGDWVREPKHFWLRETEIEGIPDAVARSGWSRQGGFELYRMDGSKGTRLWNLVKEAGKPWDMGPGNPNGCERVESGLLSCGGDSDDDTNPFEVRMGRYIDLDVPDDVTGIAALHRIKAEGPKRHQLGVMLEGDQPVVPGFKWPPHPHRRRQGRRHDQQRVLLAPAQEHRLRAVLRGLQARRCGGGDQGRAAGWRDVEGVAVPVVEASRYRGTRPVPCRDHRSLRWQSEVEVNGRRSRAYHGIRERSPVIPSF